MSEEKELNAQEMEQLASAIGYGSSLPEGKHNVHTFLHNVATADDTTKVGYLKEEEIGLPKNPLRTYKNMALIAMSIMDNKDLAEYYLQKGEILSSTSLSKDGFLVKLAVVQRRELADVTKSGKKSNSSWFKKKDKEEESPQ